MKKGRNKFGVCRLKFVVALLIPRMVIKQRNNKNQNDKPQTYFYPYAVLATAGFALAAP